MVHNVGGVGGTPDPNYIKQRSRKGQIAGNSQVVGNSSQLIQQGDYYFPGRPLVNGFSWNKFKNDLNVTQVNRTTNNNQGINVSGESRGIAFVPAETLGNYSDITQEITSLGDTDQLAKTHGSGSDIVLTGQSKNGNVIQIADANRGNIDLDAASNLGWSRQDAFASFGDITMNSTSEKGSEMSAFAVDGDIKQINHWGDSVQELYSAGSGHSAVQESAGGNDTQTMDISASNFRSSQSAGTGNDVVTYEVTGSNNEHLIQLGDGRDRGAAIFYPDSSNNKVTILGGEVKGGNVDRTPDEFVVVLNGKNQRVAVNPSLSGNISQNDKLMLDVHSPDSLKKLQANDPNYAYSIYDPSTNSYIDVGHSVGEVGFFQSDW